MKIKNPDYVDPNAARKAQIKTDIAAYCQANTDKPDIELDDLVAAVAVSKPTQGEVQQACIDLGLEVDA